MSSRCYSELRQIETFIGRYQYLSLTREELEQSIPFERYIKQRFYRSKEWIAVRSRVIVRDMGFDLGVQGLEICERPLVHHMNPIRVDFFSDSDLHDYLLNPEYLITISLTTHNCLHTGRKEPEQTVPVERRPDDQILWKRLSVPID